MERKEKAMSYFHDGYNCSQAIVLAFSDLIGLDESTALKLSSSFGGGMGRLREVCGAFSGMIMVAGILYGYDKADDTTAKKEHYRRIQELAESFKNANKPDNAKDGSIVCRELLGIEKGKDEGGDPAKRTEQYYSKRPCELIVGSAAEILETYINEHSY